ncbi:unnamed protein product [Callosobruchus maculatus]|uniref:BPTI/Kunitz inhibitor domain-containing protein n=1 Tax=Callosobruchus maculatus TaxID=64391 RepID=A0A653BEL6_CALMS|nr:unnamed protein product [Callosobruchus maculatus]
MKTMTCIADVYGGCEPSNNNFNTLEECMDVAYPVCTTGPKPGISKPFEIADCIQDVEGFVGCKVSIEVYKWSVEENQCVKAIYGGCHSTRNNFATLEECDAVARPICVDQLFFSN